MTDRQIAICSVWVAIISLVVSVIALFFQDTIKYYFMMSPEEKIRSENYDPESNNDFWRAYVRKNKNMISLYQELKKNNPDKYNYLTLEKTPSKYTDATLQTHEDNFIDFLRYDYERKLISFYMENSSLINKQEVCKTANNLNLEEQEKELLASTTAELRKQFLLEEAKCYITNYQKLNDKNYYAPSRNHVEDLERRICLSEMRNAINSKKLNSWIANMEKRTGIQAKCPK
jgi:hypothetical protein|nr:hypothetical protein [uncultured Kingella sp.]